MYAREHSRQILCTYHDCSVCIKTELHSAFGLHNSGGRKPAVGAALTFRFSRGSLIFTPLPSASATSCDKQHQRKYSPVQGNHFLH